MSKLCKHCGADFEVAFPSWSRKQFCSQHCHYSWRKKQTLANFWNRVHKTETCWLWTGSIRPNGYGTIGRKGISTHRLAWELTYGPVPQALQVLHHCDNPPCVNPLHLFLGTHIDNMKDKSQKGRAPRGLQNGAYRRSTTKLTIELVGLIKTLYKNGLPQKEVAAQVGVTQSEVSRVLSGKRWAITTD